MAWFVFSTQADGPAPSFPATANRDCAPWDGSAFTVTIPMSDGSILSISIYRSPDIKLPASFSFPDETGGIGSASLLLPAGTPEQLTGEVMFRRVEQGVPVEGEFELLSETGGQFKGRFKAEWENQPVYCG